MSNRMPPPACRQLPWHACTSCNQRIAKGFSKFVRCLSHTTIPFEGTCWMTDEQKHFARLTAGFLFVVLDADRKALTDEWGRTLVKTKSMTFDSLPLGYLDWLSGQAWVYGEFRQRLTAYMARPCIQHELEQMFPDENVNRVTGAIRLDRQWVPNGKWRQVEGEWYQDADPLYIEMGTCWCDPMESRYSKWHGQPMPHAEDEDPTLQPWQPPSTWAQRRKAWQTAADALFLFENGTGQFEDLNQLDVEAIREAMAHLTRPAAQMLREKFAEWHNRLREAVHEDDAIEYRIAMFAEAFDYLSVLFQGPNHERFLNVRIKLRSSRRQCVQKRHTIKPGRHYVYEAHVVHNVRTKHTQFATCGIGDRNLRTRNPRKERRSAIAC